MSNTNEETKTVDVGYGEASPFVGKKRTASIPVSSLPLQIRAAASKLDVDRDGALDSDEVANVIFSLDQNRKTNKNLRKAVVGFVVLTCFLVACIFGASITAARLSRDLVVNHDNGFAYVKGSNSDVVKTSEAIVFQTGMNIGEMSDEQLSHIREINLEEGSLRFMVKGHARDPLNDWVILIVEGGTLSFDTEGIVDARGDAEYILEIVYGTRGRFVHGTQRSLYYTCGASVTIGSYPYEPSGALFNPWSF